MQWKFSGLEYQKSSGDLVDREKAILGIGNNINHGKEFGMNIECPRGEE